MKYHTSNRELRQGSRIVLGFSYCEIQNIERFLNATAYTSGAYGWKSDIYEFESFRISTGYSPLNFIFSYDKESKKQMITESEEIRKYILKLEGKIRFKKIKLPFDWLKAHKKILNLINAAASRAYKKSLSA